MKFIKFNDIREIIAMKPGYNDPAEKDELFSVTITYESPDYGILTSPVFVDTYETRDFFDTVKGHVPENVIREITSKRKFAQKQNYVR